MASAVVETIEDASRYISGTVTCTAPIPFGHKDPWLYFPDTKQFDLTRGSESRLLVTAEEDVYNHRGFMFNPEKAALVIVDMQNYFIHPTYRHHRSGLAAVQPILKVIEKCRREGIQVLWLNWIVNDDTLQNLPPAIQRTFSQTLGWHVALGSELPDGQGRCLFQGTWNAELYEPLKAVAHDSDGFFNKSRISGLWSTSEPIQHYLRESGIKTLFFAGVNTDQCVLGTLTDAYSSGFDCVLLKDCTGTMTGKQAQDVCEYNISANLGFVTDSKTFMKAESI